MFIDHVRRFRALALGAFMSILLCGSALRAEEPPAETHGQRAAAAMEERSYGRAWLHARQGVCSGAADVQAEQIFGGLWAAFDRQGHLNARRSRAEVTKALGPPDREQEAPGAHRLEYGYMAVDFRDDHLVATIDLRGMTRQAMQPREKIDAPDDGRGWVLGHCQVNRNQVNTEYVLPGQNVQNWQELLSVQRLVGLGDREVPIRSFADTMQSSLMQSAPNCQWRILDENETEIIYEFVIPGGGEHPDQHEVARLVRGRHDIHRIAYARKGERLPDELRDGWIERLRGPQLTEIKVSAAAAGAE